MKHYDYLIVGAGLIGQVGAAAGILVLQREEDVFGGDGGAVFPGHPVFDGIGPGGRIRRFPGGEQRMEGAFGILPDERDVRGRAGEHLVGVFADRSRFDRGGRADHQAVKRIDGRGLGWRVFLNAVGAPTGLIATNEAGVAVYPEWRHAPPAFCFNPSWDTVRVVSAGPDDADGRVRVEIGPDGTLFIMR